MEGATATGSLNNDDGDSRVVYQHFEDLADSSTRSESLTQRLRQHLHGNSCGSSVNVNFSASSGDGDDSGAGGRITAADELRDELRREPGALADYMRFKLRFHFMNPIEKWKTRGRFPLKLTLQIIKLIVVTIQVIVFGMDSGSFQTRHRNTYMALEHILLKDWDTSRDVLVYPPPAGPYAVHTKQGFYEHANHVIAQYSTITTAPIGTFGYSSPNGEMVPIRFCETSYRHGTVWPFNSTLDFNGVVVTTCTLINTTWPANDEAWATFSIERFLQNELKFDTLIVAELMFSLKVFYRTKMDQMQLLHCNEHDITIAYKNAKHDGQLDISMMLDPSHVSCHKNLQELPAKPTTYYGRQALNILTIVMCSLSTVLCLRSLYRAQKLRCKTARFFEKHLGKKLSWTDELQFVDFWFIMIILADGILQAGSAVKMQIEERLLPGFMHDACSLLLGCGTLLAWCGLLRYVGYFQTYNILLLTLKKSIPNVIRFLLCAMLLFCGYVMCGWVVIGPHHIKFRTLSTAAECLFSIMNGDDIFATYAMLFEKNSLVWYFAQAYMYSFVVLFVYLVVSLFVAIFVDVYETIRDTEAESAPSTIQAFIAEVVDDPASGLYRFDDELEKRLGSRNLLRI